MSEKLLKLGQFLRLLDAYNEISLSNVALMVMIYKLGHIAVPTWQEAAAFLAAMYAYQEKRKLEP